MVGVCLDQKDPSSQGGPARLGIQGQCCEKDGDASHVGIGLRCERESSCRYWRNSFSISEATCVARIPLPSLVK